MLLPTADEFCLLCGAPNPEILVIRSTGFFERQREIKCHELVEALVRYKLGQLMMGAQVTDNVVGWYVGDAAHIIWQTREFSESSGFEAILPTIRLVFLDTVWVRYDSPTFDTSLRHCIGGDKIRHLGRPAETTLLVNINIIWERFQEELAKHREGNPDDKPDQVDPDEGIAGDRSLRNVFDGDSD